MTALRPLIRLARGGDAMRLRVEHVAGSLLMDGRQITLAECDRCCADWTRKAWMLEMQFHPLGARVRRSAQEASLAVTLCRNWRRCADPHAADEIKGETA
ncbi:MAG: hypothetical protein ACREQ5_35700 [Candidatus Dormibacteria bacterium]